MSSFHFILDLEILRDFAAKLSTVGAQLQPDGFEPTDHAKFSALAKAMRAEFQTVYFGRHNATQSFGGSDTTPRSFCTPCDMQVGAKSCTCLTQDQNVPTLWRRMAPADAEDEVLATVLEAIRKPNGKAGVSAPGRITTGLVGTHLILPLLSRHNHSDLALQLAMGTELPSWGYMIENGATTLWESWSGSPDISLHQPPSHNHHFLGGCVQWFHDSLVGLSQGNGTAYSDMRIAPDIVTSPELPSMAGVYDLPRGQVRVAWASSAGSPLTLNVSLPPNTRATVVVPPGRGRHCAQAGYRLSEGSALLWAAEDERLEEMDGVQAVGCRPDGAVELRVGSGSYSFRVDGARKRALKTEESLDAIVERELKRAGKNIIAFSAVGISRGKVAWSKVAGVSDYNNSVPVTPDTRFMWARVSKTVVSYAAMLMVDRGHLDLDDDVSDVVGFRLRHPHHNSTAITLRMLLTHMSSINDAYEYYVLPSLCVKGDSGLANGKWLQDYLVPTGKYFGGVSVEKGSWYKAKPGTKYEYSNEGASLAAFVAEKAAKRAGLIEAHETVSDLVRGHVFARIGVTKGNVSYFLKDLPSAPSDLQYPSAYYPDYKGLRPIEEYFIYDYPEYPCGRWMASPRDQAALLINFMHNGTSPGHDPLLNASTVAEMRTPQSIVHGADPPGSQGLIWYYYKQGPRTLLGHDGCDWGTSTDMFFNPRTGAGFVLATSADCESDAVGKAQEAIEIAIMDAMEGLPDSGARGGGGENTGARQARKRWRQRPQRDFRSTSDATSRGPCWWL